MKRIIQVSLDEDTADFLERNRRHDTEDSVSAFINSLIRQESFRQGYFISGEPDYSSHPASNPLIEQRMLQRSGLLPWPGKRRR